MPPRAPRPPRGPRSVFFVCAELNLEFYFLCGVLRVITVEIDISEGLGADICVFVLMCLVAVWRQT